MTKSVDAELSQHEGVKPPTSISRTRKLLVALLGFGAADLLILNLWAVPNLLTNPRGASGTTTDLRAWNAIAGDTQGSVDGAVSATGLAYNLVTHG